MDDELVETIRETMLSALETMRGLKVDREVENAFDLLKKSRDGAEPFSKAVEATKGAVASFSKTIGNLTDQVSTLFLETEKQKAVISSLRSSLSTEKKSAKELLQKRAKQTAAMSNLQAACETYKKKMLNQREEITKLHQQREQEAIAAIPKKFKDALEDLTVRLTKVEQEAESAKAERDTAKTERDTAKAERDTAKAERDTAKAERDTAKADREVLRARLDRLESQKEVVTWLLEYFDDLSVY